VGGHLGGPAGSPGRRSARRTDPALHRTSDRRGTSARSSGRLRVRLRTPCRELSAGTRVSSHRGAAPGRAVPAGHRRCRAERPAGDRVRWRPLARRRRLVPRSAPPAGARTAGVDFERVRGSSFYRDPDAAMRPVWRHLNDLGIPTGKDGWLPPRAESLVRCAGRRRSRRSRRRILRADLTQPWTSTISLSWNLRPATSRAPSRLMLPRGRGNQQSTIRGPHRLGAARLVRGQSRPAGRTRGSGSRLAGDRQGGAIDRRRIPTSGLVPAATVWVDQQRPRRRIIQQRKASRISRGANTSGGHSARALPDVGAAFGATRRLR